MAAPFYNLKRHVQGIDDEDDLFSEEMPLNREIIDPCLCNEGNVENISRGVPYETIVPRHHRLPYIQDMENIRDKNSVFMILPFKYDPSNPEKRPNTSNWSADQSDLDPVFMPYSKHNVTNKKQSIWSMHCESLGHLKKMCDDQIATIQNLKKTIRQCMNKHCELGSLEKLINDTYSNEERGHFMSTVLSNLCNLALHVEKICGQPPPLLASGKNGSVTMSQEQAASLLACSFFCLYPNRSDLRRKEQYRKFPYPNFDLLYKSGHPRKIEKLKCIFNYFRRITQKMPTGVITFQRYVLTQERLPKWKDSKTRVCDLHLTTAQKIEDINNVLQVDFANKFIGGGVLSSGCVQEEIRFTICPEMIVTTLICERMEDNECIFLIGCERYSSYKGYADSFQFVEDYFDTTPKDNWGRKWCHLVAMDAIYFRHKSAQYNMTDASRELLKAYTSFFPLESLPNSRCSIATGNWGCGAFNGDKHVKAIIQLMAASQAERSLMYAAYRDKNLINSFDVVYNYLKEQRATVGDLFRCLNQYFAQSNDITLFEYILGKSLPLSS